MSSLFKVIIFSLVFGVLHSEITDFLDNFVHPYEHYEANNVVTRIVGGENASEKQFPYEAGILVFKESSTAFCGGSLISQSFVLTAAHCFENAISVQVRLGAYQILVNESTQLRINSTNFTVHPQWDNTTLTNDIAIINLNQNVTLTDYIQPIRLTTDFNNTYAGFNGTVAGWGKTNDNQTSVSSNLMYFTNPIITNEACSEYKPFENVIQMTNMCIDGAGGKSICSGDSGGPLTVDGVQVGLVSFGYKSCEEEMPQVFTRLTEFYEWIKENSDIDY